MVLQKNQESFGANIIMHGMVLMLEVSGIQA
jgi:hypothetical protein